MSVKYGILSLLAVVIISVLAVKNYETWTAPAATVERPVLRKMAVKAETPPAPQGQKGTDSLQSCILVAQKNLFTPDRKEFPIVVPAAVGGDGARESKKPIVRPQIVLYGVTIIGDYQSASLSSPGRPLKKGEREVMTLKVGESLGEYKLAKVMQDRITLEAPGDSFDVMLYTPKQRTYAKTELKPAMVTSTAAAPPGAPTAPAAPRPGVAQPSPQGSIAESHLPRPVTPAATPSVTPRARRWSPPSSSGSAPAPSPLAPPGQSSSGPPMSIGP